MPEKGLKLFRNLTFALIILVFAYGIIVYPNAPITPVGSMFIDKAGKQYFYTEFMNFKKMGIYLNNIL